MNRLAGSALLAAVIPALVYDAVVLLIAPPQGAVVWLSLAMLNAAYLAALFARSGAPSGKNAAIVGYPLAYLAVGYLLVEFLLTTLIVFVPAIADLAETSGKAVLAIQLVLGGAFATVFFVTVSAGEATAQAAAQLAEERNFTQTASTGLRRFSSQTEDPTLARKARSLEETLRFGAVTSSPSVRGLEAQILAIVDDLDLVADAETGAPRLAEIERLLADRKDRLRLSQ